MKEFDRFFSAQYNTYTLDLEFWISHARSQGSPLLELGCGAGRILIPLAEGGFSITGLDNDPAMLNRLRGELSEEAESRVTLVEAAIEDFELPDKFRLVFSPCNTFSYLSASSALQALRCVHDHLLPGGLLVLDLPNPGFLLNSPIDPHEPVDSFFEPEAQRPVQVYADQVLHGDSERVDVTWHYDELHPDGFVQRHDYSIQYHLRMPDVLEEMLETSGFSCIQFAGGYSGQLFSEYSHRLIAAAMRPE